VAVKYSYDKKEGFLENKIDPFREFQILKKELEKEKLKNSLKRIATDIKTAEEEKDDEALDLLMEEFTKISKKIEKNETE